MIPKPISIILSVILFLIISHTSVAQNAAGYDAIYSGIPWYDAAGKVVSAHAANIIKDNGRYYLFGEAHTDTSNAFAGFNCYSSPDLYNWKFESVAFPVQTGGRLGANRVGERVKVMKSPKTGEYVMFMHTDTLGYKDPCIGYATARNATGPYVFRGPLLFNGNPIKKWDMGTFQDKDGAGYLLVHGGQIFKLNDDYKSITEQVLKDMSPECESPAIFRKGNVYYFLASHRTSWERNDNFYYTANTLKGPWTNRGIFTPQGTLTWNSQTTYVLPIEGTRDTTYMFMGDRWSFPLQNSSATYVWQPLTISGLSLSIPKYQEAWTVNTLIGEATPKAKMGTVLSNTDKRIQYSGKWEHSVKADTLVSTSAVKGASFTIKFKGRQIGLYGLARPVNGYARVVLYNNKGVAVLNSMVDMYSKYTVAALKFLTPVMAAHSYTLTVTVMGIRPNWTDKKKTSYGSIGNAITLHKVVINQ